jgi:hypothetical protein
MTAAVLDACVLYPAALRDLWMHLAVRFVFQPKWTARIQDELAAAVAGGVPVIVTFNLAHFPAAALSPHGVRAVHPDTFAGELLEAEPEAFLLAVRTHRAALKNPPKPVEDYLETLRRAGLVQTAARLEPYQDQL